MECRMDGRVAIITGGSLGLGRAMALEFARSGAKVAMVARRADVLEEAKAEILSAAPGVTVNGYACDMCDAGAIKAMHASVVADLGDVLRGEVPKWRLRNAWKSDLPTQWLF